ncbi:MAG: GxxExxY protein [Verrucomicrobiales bacterium]|nr:GxxExxY protein [Verrucomicrobiales bacterium]
MNPTLNASSKRSVSENKTNLAQRRGDAEFFMEDLNVITGEIVDAAFYLHSKLGPGLLESVYEVILARELAKRGLHVERQKVVPIEFEGLRFDEGFRADLIVESAVVVELKSVEILTRGHAKQLLTYLKLLNLPVGLLINFSAPVIKAGIKRLVNNLPESQPQKLRVSASPRES